MKKVISVFLSVVMICISLSVISFAKGDENVLVSSQNGCKIIISSDCTENESYAAGVMQKYVKEITGITVPVENDLSKKTSSEVVIGNTLRKNVDISTVPSGGYRILSEDDSLYINGSGSDGNVRGVYGFLEKSCSCKWYTQNLNVIPSSDTILLEETDYTYTPYFEYTDADWRSPRNDEYSLSNGLNGGVYRTLTEEQGGTVDYISGFCHTLTTEFCSADKYFNEHPEYFALRDEGRSSEQLCLTN